MAALVLGICCACFAQVEDGFPSAGKVRGEYFTVYYAPQVDISSLPSKLNIHIADEFMTGRKSTTSLAGMVDTLFRQVCDFLDMQLYSFEGSVKVCVDEDQLEQIYQRLFGKSLKGKKSFYVFELATIYVSEDNFRREILGHEMAHAIICRYFAVPPPVKMQEVLATYVEFQLRKAYQ
jgi:hypothetical protein